MCETNFSAVAHTRKKKTVLLYHFDLFDSFYFWSCCKKKKILIHISKYKNQWKNTNASHYECEIFTKNSWNLRTIGLVILIRQTVTHSHIQCVCMCVAIATVHRQFSPHQIPVGIVCIKWHKNAHFSCMKWHKGERSL